MHEMKVERDKTKVVKGSPTRAGEPATNTTTAEFNVVMKKIMAKLKALRDKNPRNFVGGISVVVDNARFHVEAIKELRERAIEIPPMSPEFNKPIEHLFSSIKAEFWRRYSNLMIEAGGQRFVPLEVAKAMLEKVVEDVVTPEVIARDVKGLTKTYQSVIDAKGGYISSRVS